MVRLFYGRFRTNLVRTIVRVLLNTNKHSLTHTSYVKTLANLRSRSFLFPSLVKSLTGRRLDAITTFDLGISSADKGESCVQVPTCGRWRRRSADQSSSAHKKTTHGLGSAGSGRKQTGAPVPRGATVTRAFECRGRGE